jgi:hypothetical protein
MMETPSIYRSSILPSQIGIETCNCQCPMSGLIPIFYNNDQQSCTIGMRRKRRDHHFDDDDCSSPID